MSGFSDFGGVLGLDLEGLQACNSSREAMFI